MMKCKPAMHFVWWNIFHLHHSTNNVHLVIRTSNHPSIHQPINQSINQLVLTQKHERQIMKLRTSQRKPEITQILKLLICFKWNQLGAHYFLVYLFQLLYIFRATMFPSLGELTVSMRRWYFSLCMCGCLVCWLWWDSSQPADQTATHTEWKISASHRYSKFSWWWERGCPKHVEKLK